MTTPIPITVVILTRNEEAGIAATLGHLRDFADVVIVDSASTDRTREIAASLGSRVVRFEWNGRYPKKKQWAIDNAVPDGVDWVLIVDADEYPSPELVEQVRAVVDGRGDPDVGAYDLELTYRFAGRFLRHGHRVVKRSLFRRSTTRFPEVDDLAATGIREIEGHYQPQTTQRVASLPGTLMHDDRDPVSSWFERHNRYSDWEAHLRLAPAARKDIAEKRSRRGQLFEKAPFKPATFFVYGYVARLGFLDGRAGFDYHFALASYYWQIGVKTRELRRAAEHREQQPGRSAAPAR